MLPANSGGLGTDVMEIFDRFEHNLRLCQKQYKGECLSTHMPDMFRYTSIAEKLRSSGAAANQAAQEIGDLVLVQA